MIPKSVWQSTLLSKKWCEVRCKNGERKLVPGIERHLFTARFCWNLRNNQTQIYLSYLSSIRHQKLMTKINKKGRTWCIFRISLIIEWHVPNEMTIYYNVSRIWTILTGFNFGNGWLGFRLVLIVTFASKILALKVLKSDS